CREGVHASLGPKEKGSTQLPFRLCHCDRNASLLALGFSRRCFRCCCLLGGEGLGCCNLLSLEAGLFLGCGAALSVVELAGTHTGVLDDTSRLTAAVAQVVELGTANLAAADNFNAFDQWRIDRENALDAFTVGNLANR